MRGYKDYELPTLVMKGKWLKNYGFKVGSDYNVTCQDKKLVIEVK